MMSSTRRRLGVFLAAFLLVAAEPAAHGSEVDAWRATLQEIDHHLRAGEYRPAQKKSRRLADRVVDRLGTGDPAAYTLAVTCVFRALAEAGLGNDRDADWYWWTAYSIFNDATKTDLSPYGEAAEFLKSRKFRDRTGKPDLVTRSGPQFSNPVVRKRGKPPYPELLRRMAVRTSYAVQVIVEPDGSISGPLVLKKVKEPAMAYVILETLRSWKFEPARLDGEPVPVLYTLTVNFKLRGLE
jgi:hypothetical protein